MGDELFGLVGPGPFRQAASLTLGRGRSKATVRLERTLRPGRWRITASAVVASGGGHARAARTVRFRR